MTLKLLRLRGASVADAMPAPEIGSAVNTACEKTLLSRLSYLVAFKTFLLFLPRINNEVFLGAASAVCPEWDWRR
jgi:hypothetical protein